MKITYHDTKKDIELPAFPFIIVDESGLLRIVTYRHSDYNKFLLTDLVDSYPGYTFSDDDYTIDFLEKKIAKKQWRIIDSELVLSKEVNN